MKLVRQVIVLLAVMVVLAKPVTAHAGCTDNSFFPLAAGTTRTYQAPSGQTNQLVVQGVSAGGVVTAIGTVSGIATPATVTITCITTGPPGTQGIQFDMSRAVSGTGASATITSQSGPTIPLPDQFKLYGSAGSGVGQWTHSFDVVTQNGPIAITMHTTEVHTVVGVPPTETVRVPGYATPRGAFKIQVLTTSTFGGITGLPANAPVPHIPPSSSTIFEWIVEHVGLVQYGRAGGPYTVLTSCAPAGSPSNAPPSCPP
jgi:hypothetical protein